MLPLSSLKAPAVRRVFLHTTRSLGMSIKNTEGQTIVACGITLHEC